MGACPGQIPMPCVRPALMVTATMVRACRYIFSTELIFLNESLFSNRVVFVEQNNFGTI